MNISYSKERAGVLVAVLVILGVLAITLLANLTLVSNERRMISRDQAWNATLPMCEAGVEDALAHLNYTGATNLGSDGWGLTNRSYLRTNALPGGYYSVTISTASPPVIVSQGFVFAPGLSNYITRTVQVITRLNGLFPNALLGKEGVNLSGGGSVDSYDSSDESRSTSGRYDHSKADGHARVCSPDGDISVDDDRICGWADTGPGRNVNVGSHGEVWDHEDSDHGGSIQRGHSSGDVNTIVPDAVLPSLNNSLTPRSGACGGTNYTYALGGGTYVLNGDCSLNQKQAMVVSAPSVLYVSGNFTLADHAFIYVVQGASLQLYIGGDSCSFGGGGVVNCSQNAANCSVWGLPHCRTFDCDGDAPFIGTVYAPEADCTWEGDNDACGAAVGKTCSVSGGMNFHYDQALAGPVGYTYLVASWQEL